MSPNRPAQSGPDSAALSNLDPYGGAMSEAELALHSGPADPIFDSTRWETIGELAAGGMGLVTIVRDRWLDRNVAVKMPGRDQDVQRLLHEARVTAGLDHPGIVAVYDSGLSASGKPWFAMRLVRGQSLADVLAGQDDHVPRDLLRHVLAAAEAIGYANAHGVVHRDLKPANIMVGPFGETQVIDWGLALVSDQACPSPGRAGTASAMSPEQARGEPIDSRTDVYALGAILREVATRRPLFPASMERRDIIAAVAQGAIPPLPEDGLATELRAVIQRAMHPDKLRRYPDAKSFADDLARYLDGRRVTAHAYTPRELLTRLWRAWKVPFILTVVALTIVVTTLTIAVAEVSSERDHSERTLGRSLVASARTALREDDRGQAEVLALAALDRGEFPEAMGVLAALPVERPTREIEAVSGCEVADVTDIGNIGNIGETKYADNIGTTQSRRILCRGPKTLSVREGEKTLWTRELATQAAVFVGAGEGLVVQIDGTRVERLDARTGLPHAPAGALENTCPYGSIQRAPGGQFALHHSSGCAVVIGLHSEQPIPLDLCDEPSIRAIALGTDGQSWALVCTDGGLVTGRFDHERGARFETAFAVAPERPLATAIAVIDDHSLLIGDSDGGLSLVELARPRDRRRLVPRSGLIREVHYEPTQGLALVHYERGADPLQRHQVPESLN